jgi:hypothetical protein
MSPAASAVAVGALTLAGLASRLSQLNASLWYDEMWSTHIKLGNLVMLGHQVLYDAHPPTYVGFMYVWIRLFGDSELSVRMPSLLGGCLSIVLLYLVGKRVVGQGAALCAAALLAFSPPHIWYSQEARPYSLAICLLLVATLAYYKLLEEPRARGWYIAYTAAMSAAVFSHYFIAIFLGSISLLCLPAIRREPSRSLFIINLSIAGALAAFLLVKYVFGVTPTGLYYLRSFTLGEWWALYFDWFLLARSFVDVSSPGTWLLLAVQAVFFGLLLRGLWLMLSRADPERQIPALTTLLFMAGLPAALFSLTLVGLHNLYIERSTLVVLPFFLLVLARGLVDERRRLASVLSVTFAIVVTAATLTTFYSRTVADRITVADPKPDWRHAAAYLAPQAAASGPAQPSVVFAVTPPISLSYYDAQIGERGELKNKGMAKFDRVKKVLGETNPVVRWLEPQVAQYLNDVTGEVTLEVVRVDHAQAMVDALVHRRAGEFYLLHDKFWPGEFDQLFKEITADRRFSRLGVEQFRGIEIYRFRLADTLPSL